MALQLRRAFSFSKKQTVFNKWQSKWTELIDRIKNFETPERYKDTFVERWGKYWRNVFLDYREVGVDIVKGCKERPIRASVYATIFGGTYYLAKHNPDEISYKEQYLLNTMKLVPVGPSVRNPMAVEHIRFLQQCYNDNVLRRLNLGIISLMWIDNYDSAIAHYRATCTYLRPSYLTFHRRIIDVGCLDTWWVWRDKMIDYDVNDQEFENQ